MDFRLRREDHDAIDAAYREDLARNDAEYVELLANQPDVAQRTAWGLEDTPERPTQPEPELRPDLRWGALALLARALWGKKRWVKE